MALGAATEGRGLYKTYNASLLFLDGFMRNKTIGSLHFGIWCILPVKVCCYHAYSPVSTLIIHYSSLHCSTGLRPQWNNSPTTSNAGSSKSLQPALITIAPSLARPTTGIAPNHCSIDSIFTTQRSPVSQRSSAPTPRNASLMPRYLSDMSHIASHRPRKFALTKAPPSPRLQHFFTMLSSITRLPSYDLFVKAPTRLQHRHFSCRSGSPSLP